MTTTELPPPTIVETEQATAAAKWVDTTLKDLETSDDKADRLARFFDQGPTVAQFAAAVRFFAPESDTVTLDRWANIILDHAEANGQHLVGPLGGYLDRVLTDCETTVEDRAAKIRLRLFKDVGDVTAPESVTMLTEALTRCGITADDGETAAFSVTPAPKAPAAEEKPCPHCDKSYKNLGRHISAAHPETLEG